MVDYTLWKVIGKGAERICYLDPEDTSRLVKISPIAHSKQTRREISYFNFLIKKQVPFDHIPKFYGEVRGDGFIGLAQEFIHDTDVPGVPVTTCSQSLDDYLGQPLSHQELVRFNNEMDRLRDYLLQYNIIPCDLSTQNIVVQKTPEGIRLVLIDGFGGTELIPVVNYFRCLGSPKIARKWEKFSGKLASLYPQIDL